MFRFVTLTLEIPEKTNFHPRYSAKLCYIHLLEIPTPINKTHGNSIWFFLDHPLEFKHALSSVPLEIPGPQPTHPPPCPICFFLERNSHLKFSPSTCGGNLCNGQKLHNNYKINILGAKHTSGGIKPIFGLEKYCSMNFF